MKAKARLKNLFRIGLCLTCLAFAIGAAAGCSSDKTPADDDDHNVPGEITDDGKDETPSGVTEYVYEAEHTYVEDLELPGSSGITYYPSVIYANTNASNGYCISALNGANSTLEFIFSSDKACTSTFKALMNSDINGKMTFAGDELYIYVNGTKLDYKSFTLSSVATQRAPEFTEINFGDIELKEGENVIKFVTGDNEYNRGAPGGPSIDCIILGNEAALTWEKLNTDITGE